MKGLDSPDFFNFQLVALLLLVLLLWKLPILKVKPPLLILIVPAFLALLLSSRSVYQEFLPDHFISLTRLEGDSMDAKSSLLLRRFKRSVARAMPSATRPLSSDLLWKEYKSLDQISYLLQSRPATQLVVWGSTRWLNLSFRSESAAQLSQFLPFQSLSDISNLTLIKSVPLIGLSMEPIEPSSRFIALIALSLISKETQPYLLQAAHELAGWTSFAHGAWAWWQLGNQNLFEALDQQLDRAALRCAQQSYSGALALLRPGDNFELQAAILNNLALAHYLEYIFYGGYVHKKRAISLLRDSFASLEQENSFGQIARAPLIAKLNLITLRNVKIIKKTKAAARKDVTRE